MALTNAELMKKLSSNPRFRPAEKSGQAYVIPGAKPAEPHIAAPDVCDGTSAVGESRHRIHWSTD
jgi:hypothetical protein